MSALIVTQEEADVLLSCLLGRAEQQRGMYGSVDPTVQELIEKLVPAPVVEEVAAPAEVEDVVAEAEEAPAEVAEETSEEE